EDLERILIALLGDLLESAIHHALRNRLFPARHHDVDELRHVLADVLGIGQNFPLGQLSASGHVSSSNLLNSPAQAGWGVGPMPPSGASPRTSSGPACGPSRLACRDFRARCDTARRA